MKFIRVRILIAENPAQESWVIDLSLMDWSAKMNVVTLVVEITSRESSKSLENLRNERFASSRLMFKKSWSKNIELQEFWQILKILNPLIVMTMLLKILVISSIVNPPKKSRSKNSETELFKTSKIIKIGSRSSDNRLARFSQKICIIRTPFPMVYYHSKKNCYMLTLPLKLHFQVF